MEENSLDDFGGADGLEPFEDFCLCAEEDEGRGMAEGERDLVAEHGGCHNPLVSWEVAY